MICIAICPFSKQFYINPCLVYYQTLLGQANLPILPFKQLRPLLINKYIYYFDYC